MGAEGRMDDYTRQDFLFAVDDHGLALEDLAVDLLHGERHVPASRRPVATTPIRVDRPDVLLGIVQAPLDRGELGLLHIEYSVRKVGQLAGMIPVGGAGYRLGPVR